MVNYMQYGLIMLLVFGLQVGLYVVLPAWALRRYRWDSKGEWLFGSVLAGLATAALLGRVCNGSGIGVSTAFAVWLVGWVVFGSRLRCRRGISSGGSSGEQGEKDTRSRRGVPRTQLRDQNKWSNWWLLGVLALAWVVRIVHPLQTWALGQSDAYSHLGFLMDVLEHGKVGNPEYPSAYAWVMAFPAWLSRIHPYWMARFGGAFFGVILSLGVYVLTTRWRGRVAGLAAAALVAGCPVFFLLQKTGVDSFANQLGLVFVVAAIWFFSERRFGWLILTLLALGVSVPMMLIHVLILLTLMILSEKWTLRRYIGFALMFLALGCGLLLIFARMPPTRGAVIAGMLIGDGMVLQGMDIGWGAIISALLRDFLHLKRVGYGIIVIDIAAIGVALAFALTLLIGVYRKNRCLRYLGLWGVLTSANVHLGWLQFTDYQREGWSYLLALASLLGICFGWLLNSIDALWSRRVNVTSIILASMAGVFLPPSHSILAGESESDVVRFVLGLEPDVTVLTRKTSDFAGGQGDVVRTLHKHTIHSMEEMGDVVGDILFLRDYPAKEPNLPLAMRLLQPSRMDEMRRYGVASETRTLELAEQLRDKCESIKAISSYLEVWHVR